MRCRLRHLPGSVLHACWGPSCRPGTVHHHRLEIQAQQLHLCLVSCCNVLRLQQCHCGLAPLWACPEDAAGRGRSDLLTARLAAEGSITSRFEHGCFLSHTPCSPWCTGGVQHVICLYPMACAHMACLSPQLTQGRHLLHDPPGLTSVCAQASEDAQTGYDLFL